MSIIEYSAELFNEKNQKGLIFLILFELAFFSTVVLVPAAGLFVLGGAGLLTLLILALDDFVYGLFFLMISIFFGRIELIQTPPVFYIDVLIFFLFSLFILSRVYVQNLSIHFSHPSIVAFSLAFIIFCSMRLYFAVDFVWGMFSLRYLFAGVMIFLLLDNVMNEPRQIRKLFNFFIVWGILLSVQVFFVSSREGNIQADEFHKGLRLGWGRSNYLASLLILIIPMAYAMLFSKSTQWTKKTGYWFGFLAMMIALILTGSRGGFLAILIPMIILSRKFLKNSRILIYSSVVFVPFVVFYFREAFLYVFSGLMNIDKQVTVLTRLINWIGSWKAFIHHPLTGVGYGNLGYYIKNVFETNTSAHNIILSLLGETGIIGFMLFAALLWRLMKIQRKNLELPDEEDALMAWGIYAGTVGVLCHSLVEPSIWGYQMQILLWITFGMSVKQQSLLKRNRVS